MEFSKKLPSDAKRSKARARTTAAPKPKTPARSGRVNPLLTREGTVVRFEPNAASALLYSHAPPAGTLGTTVSLSVPGAGRKVYIPGPGGGLVYVGWDGYGTQGVAPGDLEVVSSPRAKKAAGGGSLTPAQQQIFDRAARAIRRDASGGAIPRGVRSWQALQGVRDANSYLLNSRGEIGASAPENPFDLNRFLTPVIEHLDRWLKDGGAEKGLPRPNPAKRRRAPSDDPTSRMIQHGMCDAWLCTNIAQYETRSERGEARRLCKKCLRVVAQAEANKAAASSSRARRS